MKDYWVTELRAGWPSALGMLAVTVVLSLLDVNTWVYVGVLFAAMWIAGVVHDRRRIALRKGQR